MSLQDLLKQAQGGSPGAGASSGLQGLIQSSTQISERTRQAQREAEALEFQSEASNSWGSIIKGTVRGIVDVPLNAARAYKDSFNALPGKFSETIKQGAEEYQNREPLSLAKAGFRMAGDTAEFVFAPLSSAIGSILHASGGQKLTDAAGQKIADKSGITDWEAFQKFAMEHPNAGADFNRLLNLATLGVEGSAKVNPAQLLSEVSSVARKVVKPTPTPTGLKKLVVEAQSGERQVPLDTSKNRMARYSQEMGYEGYTPDNQLPTIPFGPKGKSSLPTIEYGDTRTPSLPEGMRYEPMAGAKPSPLTVDQVLGNKPKSPKIETVEPQAVSGTGETKTRGLSLGVEAKAVEAKLVKDLGDLPEYGVVSMADQAQKATDIVARDYEQAKRIAKGQEVPPNDVLPESVFVAVESRAIKEGDVATLRDLANGQLASEATTMGQRIRTLAERNPDSPVTAIRKISEARRQKAGNIDVGKIKRTDVAGAKKAIDNARPTRQNWADFIREIQCK